jgi:hypothetical protein
MKTGELINLTLIQKRSFWDNPYYCGQNYKNGNKIKPRTHRTEYKTCLVLSDLYMICDHKLVSIPKEENFINADIYIEIL